MPFEFFFTERSIVVSPKPLPISFLPGDIRNGSHDNRLAWLEGFLQMGWEKKRSEQ